MSINVAWMAANFAWMAANFAWMAAKANGSVVLAHLQVSFLWESDDQGFNPFTLPFFCLPDLVAD